MIRKKAELPPQSDTPPAAIAPPPPNDPGTVSPVVTAVKQEGTAVGQMLKARQEEKAEGERSMEGLREEIMNFGVRTENQPPVNEPSTSVNTSTTAPTRATPAGGKTNEPSVPQLPPVAQVTEPPPPPNAAGDIESDEQLNVRLDPLKPRNKQEEEGYRILKAEISKKNGLARQYRDLLEKANERTKELEAKVIPDEEVKNLRASDNLVKQRAVDMLPKWREYDRQIEQVGERAVGALKDFGIDQSILDALQKRGGILAFRQSKRPAGKQFGDMTEEQWFSKHVFSRLTDDQKAQFSVLMAEAGNKAREKQEAMKTAQADAERTLKEEGDKFWATFNTEANATIMETLQELFPKFDFPTAEPVISGTETPEEKKQKEELIAEWKKVDADVVQQTARLAPIYPGKEAGRLGLQIALFPVLTKKYEQLVTDGKKKDARIAELEQFQESVKSARSLKTTTVNRQPLEPKKDEMQLSTNEALQKAGFPAA